MKRKQLIKHLFNFIMVAILVLSLISYLIVPFL